MRNAVLRLTGFLLGAGSAIALELGLLLLLSVITSRDWMPRGVGWIMFPIALGSALSGIAPRMWQQFQGSDIATRLNFRTSSYATRAGIAFPLFWLPFVGMYVFLFEPYGYMGDEEYLHLLKVLLFPPIAVWSAVWLFTKFVVTERNPNAPLQTQDANKRGQLSREENEAVAVNLTVAFVEASLLHCPRDVHSTVSAEQFLALIGFEFGAFLAAASIQNVSGTDTTRQFRTVLSKINGISEEKGSKLLSQLHELLELGNPSVDAGSNAFKAFFASRSDAEKNVVAERLWTLLKAC